jgi:hypothetical protein
MKCENFNPDGDEYLNSGLIFLALVLRTTVMKIALKFAGLVFQSPEAAAGP